MRYDIVVVGAGAAGIPAALFAAREGADVLLVEVADRIGGTFHLSTGHMSAAGTRVQAVKNIHDSAELHFADVMRISRGTVKPDLARLAVDNAADTLHWLLDIGLEIEPDHPIIHYGHEPYSIPRTYWAPEGGLAILEVLRPLVDEAVLAGALTLWTYTRMTGLLADDAGAVTGITAERGGESLEISAGAVVLTTGGFSANPDLFAALSNGYPLHGGGYHHGLGDGLEAARRVGAHVSGGEKFLPTFAGVPEPAAPGGVTFTTQTYPQFRQPWEIYVDTGGRRFVREDEPSVDSRERALASIPDMRFWAIYDSEIARHAPSFFLFEEEEVARHFAENPSYVEAASIEELADVIGCKREPLERTVREYNEAIYAGTADPLGRQHRPRPIAVPPFYAVEHLGWSILSFAGLDIDAQMRVLTASGEPIPSLYAAGEAIGFGATSGNAFVGGMSVTPAMTFGRLLGARLGKQHSRNR
jgi:succinate dehydrogenase/fumarate reductase flavoprotein subunit